jgi:long-chain acyl-CoA synthetase
MTDSPLKPWLGLYRSVPPAIQPKATTAIGMFRDTLARLPDQQIVHYFDQSLTTAEIDAASDGLACAFREWRIEPGDRIAMYLQNIPQVLITVLAAWKCGAVIVPCNPMLREKELAKILRASGCRVLVCQEDLYRDIVQGALPHTSVEHTVTTSPLEYLDARADLPKVLAGMMRTRAGRARR